MKFTELFAHSPILIQFDWCEFHAKVIDHSTFRCCLLSNLFLVTLDTQSKLVFMLANIV